MKKNSFLSAFIFFILAPCFCQNPLLDEITFGNANSEKSHSFKDNFSEIIRKGGLNESARKILPITGEPVEGGNMSFIMKTDPEKPNYVTVKLWGSDLGNCNILVLFCEGKQVGYRHLGDYDMIDISNEEAPSPGKFVYVTLPLPPLMTKGKSEIELSIRSTGRIWGYGETFDKYQKPMAEPTKGIYKAYTHTDGYLSIAKTEKQGKQPDKIKLRNSPGEEMISKLMTRLNDQIIGMLRKTNPLKQEEVHFLSEAYFIKWTKAYKDKEVISKTIETADDLYNKFTEDNKKIFQDNWITVGPVCIAIYHLFDEIKGSLDKTMENGRTRRQNWSEYMRTCVDYAKTHRRQYTNQSMIIDWNLFEVNRTLLLINIDKALPEKQTLNYLYESCGIIPWLGSETPTGPQKPLGDSYYQLTAKGLTKELGFVGYYGEITNWLTHIYEATGYIEKGIPRDTLLKKQLLKLLKARSFFRYPTVDKDGFKAMRAEAVVGWRDPDHYPGTVTYADRGNSRELSPFMTAAATLDPEALAFSQQMIDENQFFAIVDEKMSDRSLTSTHMLLRIPDEYDIVKKQMHQQTKLPMSDGMPDFVFSDEEDGVLALKNDNEILYASLYWRARYAINSLARVHYITPANERVATVFEDVKFTDSGFKYKRPERVNMAFSDARKFYPNIKSANTGEVLPIAKVPDGVKFKPGDENSYAGKGEFYTLHYGKYLIGMNCTKDKTFTLDVSKEKKAVDFSSKKQVKDNVQVAPMTTVVLITE